MADTDTAIAPPDDDVEERKGTPAEEQPAIVPAAPPAIQQAAAAPAAPAPAIQDIPGNLPETRAAGPQLQPAQHVNTPGETAVAKLSAIQRQNPFAMAMADENNIHNPFLRILSKVGTGIGAGAEGLSKDYPQIEAQRAAAAAQPSEVAGREAATAKTKAETAAIPAGTAHTEAETAALQNPKPKMVEVTGSAGPNGEVLFRDETGKTPGQFVLGQNGYEPVGGGAQAPAAGPAGPQAPTAGPQPGVAVRTAAPPTAAEAAKLAPVGDAGAADFNKQIADIPGIKAADFAVKAGDSRERADKIMADARAEQEANSKEASEKRGADAEARANQNEDLKTVQAREPDGRTIITSLGDARKRGLEDVLPADAKAVETARSTVTNVNLMEQALKSLKENLTDFDALTTKDKAYLNKILNSPEMTPAGGALGYVSGTISGSVESALQSAEYQNMTEPAKNILRNIVNLRESSLGLGKLETGGSRAMQAGIDAINATIPGRNITNAKDAEQQLQMFAGRLDDIKAEAPVLKGHAFRDNPFKAPVPQTEPTRPPNVPKGYNWNPKGPKGPGWYK